MKQRRFKGAGIAVVVLIVSLGGCDRAADTQAPAAIARSGPASVAIAIETTRKDVAGTLKPGQVVVVDNPYGDVHARFGGYEHAVETHAVLQEPPRVAHIQLTPALTADGFYTIAPRLPAGSIQQPSQRIDLSVLVPEGHDLRVRTGAGFIDVHGVRGNVDVKSDGGDIELRSIQGAIQAETTGGAIEASLGTAPRGAQQRLATTTGDIDLGIDDQLDATIDMATSALFATDFSLDVTRRPGEEPNKRARTTVGRGASKLTIESRRGQIRLRRRAGFTSVGDASSDASAGQDQDEDNDSD